MPNKVSVLVTGGEGMLGSAIARQAAAFPRFDVRAPGRADLDVRDPAALATWAEWVSGGWVVHCAARVDVEGCAREPAAARATIVDGTRNAAKLAAASNARLLYPQSFLVYDGLENPISEDAEPKPLSYYGQLKFEAEQIVREILPAATIVRMAGFFGGEAADKNFVGRIIPVMHAAMLRGETRFEVGTRIWQPTWTEDLAYNTLHLVSKNATGLYQMACVGHATFAEIAQEIVLALGWSGRLAIVPVDAASVAKAELGRRPDIAILGCDRITAENMNLQRPWRATLQAYLDHPFFDQFRMEPNP